MNKPFAPSCDRNKDTILDVLKKVITIRCRRLLEVGSGTGQHAVYFAPHFKNLQWVTSDVKAKHEGIKMWLKDAKIPNIHGPLAFEIEKDNFPKQKFDVVFMANIFHILSWKQNKALMKMLGNRLRQDAQVLIYGPFNYDGNFTSQSNEDFDQWLKKEDLKRGIRSFDDVAKIMVKNGFQLSSDYEMPANNRLLVFIKLEYVKRRESK